MHIGRDQRSQDSLARIQRPLLGAHCAHKGHRVHVATGAGSGHESQAPAVTAEDSRYVMSVQGAECDVHAGRITLPDAYPLGA
jgi:hypothetical protein